MNKRLLTALLVLLNIVIYMIFVGRVSEAVGDEEDTAAQAEFAGISFDYRPPAKKSIKKDPFSSGIRINSHNPGKVRKTPETAQIQPDFRLTGIMFDENSPEIIAVDDLDGSSILLKEGQNYKNSTVLSINKDSVIIRTGVKKFLLKENYYEEIKE